MTDFIDSALAVLVVLVINLVVTLRIRTKLPDPEARFLSRTYVQSLLLRSLGAILLNVYAGNLQVASYFWGDSSTYDDAGYYLALTWSGDLVVNPYPVTAVSGYGFVHLVAAVYFLFGRNRLLVQLVNATIGALSVIVLYAIARRLFDDGVARRAALCMAFFPQMIFWSCAMYKDPSILLCIAVSMYAVLRLREEISLGPLALFVLSTLSLITLRFYVFYMVAFATLGTFLVSQRKGLLSGLLSQLLLGAILVSALVFGIRQETLKQQTSYLSLDNLQTARLGQTTLGRSNFGADFDVSTPLGAVAAIPVGLTYLLFSPFPWAITGLRQLLTLPEMLVWYSLLPSLFRGLRYSVRHRLRDVLPILAFAAVLTVAYAVFQSNVGTAYRQRTQISMFFFVFMGVGLELKRRPAGADGP